MIRAKRATKTRPRGRCRSLEKALGVAGETIRVIVDGTPSWMGKEITLYRELR
jgi:hypothetical protein